MRRKYLANGKSEGFESHRTVAELAEYLGITRRTVIRWHKQGRIPEPHIRTDKGWKLWSPQQSSEILDEILKKRRIK